MTAFLKTSEGRYALIDAELEPFLCRYTWSLNNSGYVTNGLGFLHHLCFGPRVAKYRGTADICHLNNNKLDCRRANLAALPHWLNQVLNVRRKGGIKGICKLPSGSWKAEVAIDGGKVYLGAANTHKAAVALKLAGVELAKTLHETGASPSEIRTALAVKHSRG